MAREKRNHIVYGLTGGVTGDLDAIDGANLLDLDMALVTVAGGFTYHYTLDAASGAAESSPNIISPDANAGTKRWILNDPFGVVLEVDFDANTILAATADDTPVKLTVGEQTFLGRITGGNIAALTPAQGRILFDVSASGDVILKALMAAKGDLIGASANDTPLILSIGTNDFVLTADSGEATGMKWATPAAPTAHDLAGAEHNADTLADLNSKVSDATLDDSGDSRTPSAHDLAGALHNADTLADLNAKVSDATLDDSGDSRTPSAHDLAGALHNAATLAALNGKVSDATLIDQAAAILQSLADAKGDIIVATADNTFTRVAIGANSNVLTANSAQASGVEWAAAGAPGAHDLGGASHNADTLADLNTKVSDATLDDSGDSRTPSAHDLAGAEHNADTLADLNSKVSDGTLVDTGDIILKAFMAAKGDLIGASANDTPLILSIGTNGFVLTADSVEATGMKWATPAAPVAHNLGGAEHNADTLANLNTKVSDGTLVDTGDIILKAFMAAKGDLIGASANDTPVILTVGTNGFRLVADSGEASGLKWEAIPTASTTVSGEVELATTAETDTGTDATRAVTPDGLAGSIHGTKTVVIKVIADDTALTTGDGKTHFTVPIELNGMNLVSVGAHVYTVSSSGTPTVQIHNLTDTVDMLSTVITIDANEKDSKDAATPPVIDGTNDDVVTGDEIRIDVDVAGTGTQGLEVRMGFRTP